MSARTDNPAQPAVPQPRTPARHPGSARRRGGWHARVPGAAAAVLALLSLVSAIGAVSEVFSYHFQPVRYVVNEVLVAAPANLGYAALLAVFAGAVAARKRLAWRVLIVYFVLQVLLDAGAFTLLTIFPRAASLHRVHPWRHWLTLAGIGVSVTVLVVLWLARRRVLRPGAAGQPGQGGRVFLGLTAVFILIGWGVVSTFPGSLHRGVDTLSYAAERVLFGAFRFDVTRTGRAHAGLVNLLLGVLGAVALLTALLVLFRSQRVIAALSPPRTSSTPAPCSRRTASGTRWATSPPGATSR